MSPVPVPASAELQAQVEEVRDFLVTVRGGAPFLSGADGNLLLQWLTEGLPLPLLLCSIEAVAEKRRARRARGRLTLAACRKTVEAARRQAADLAFQGDQAPDPAPAAAPEGLARLVDEIAAMPTGPELQAAQAELVEALRALLGDARHPDVLGRAATQAVTRFHAAAWAAQAAEHGALRAQAEQELAPLRAALSGPAFSEMVEEVARDLLRQRFAVVSARRVWDSLSPPR